MSFMEKRVLRSSAITYWTSKAGAILLDCAGLAGLAALAGADLVHGRLRKSNRLFWARMGPELAARKGGNQSEYGNSTI